MNEYPQSVSDVKIGMRLLCNDNASLHNLGYTRPVYAIVRHRLFVNGETVIRMRFVDCRTGKFITEHYYHVFLSKNVVEFQQIQRMFDFLIVVREPSIKLQSS